MNGDGGGSEALEELIQAGTVIAAKMLHSAEAAGKQVTSGNIAYSATTYLQPGRLATSEGSNAFRNQYHVNNETLHKRSLPGTFHIST